MVRLLALVLVAVLGAFAVEVYTDSDFGVTETFQWLAANGMSGGYAIATNVTSAVVGAMFGGP